jgi:hypothetical protein
MLLKEHRFTFVAGTETLLFRIEELIKGPTTWPHRFKLTLPASFHSEAKTFYGQSCYETNQLLSVSALALCAGGLGFKSGRLDQIVFGDLRKLRKKPILSFAPLTRCLQSRRPPMNWCRDEAPEDLRRGGAGSELADRFVSALSTASSLRSIASRFPWWPCVGPS